VRSTVLESSYQEISRAIAPIDGAPGQWDYREQVSVLVRQGVRTADGARFMRVDYDPARAAWKDDIARIELEFTAYDADPITHAIADKLAEGRVSMERATGGSFVVEFLSAGEASSGSAETGAGSRDAWLSELRTDPRANRVAPVLLDLRFWGDSGASPVPPAEAEPYRVILNGMQQRDRTNVARHVASTGTGQEIAVLLYTNPDSQGLGMLQRIQPPYRELTTDLRLVWEYRVTAGGWVPPHEHNTEEIWYVTAGEGTYVADGEERVIRSGDAVILYAGSWHGLLADRGDIEYLVIDVGVGRANAPH
jgi:mannose-6-phosphate isomerase-like protein (cupin superfamily)